MAADKYDSVGGGAIVLLDAIHFADVNKWDRVVFESDSATLVQALCRAMVIQNSILLFLVLFISYLYIPTSR